jgi:hypothetical protein
MRWMWIGREKLRIPKQAKKQVPPLRRRPSSGRDDRVFFIGFLTGDAGRVLLSDQFLA